MVRVVADDGYLLVEVTVSIVPRKGYPLEEGELDEVAKKAGRQVASMLSGLPYSDFGADNTTVELDHQKKTVGG
jgi:hypothetical protein